MRGRSRWACVALALGLATTAVAACTTPSSPPVESTTSASTATSSSATSTSTTASRATTTLAGSDLPEAARANTADGAVAFTLFFFKEVNRSYSSMTPEPIVALSARDCRGCAIMRDSVQQWKQRGYRYVGDFITPTVVTISAFPGDQTAKVLVTSKTAESRLLTASNSVAQVFPAEDANSVVSLNYREGRWATSEVKAAG